MNFRSIQDLPSLKLYWKIAAPLAIVTIIFPVYGPRVLRWMVLETRTSFRLVLVLFIDLIALAMIISVANSAFGAANMRVYLGLCAFLLFWYVISPFVRGYKVVKEEIMVFKRLKKRSWRAYIRIVTTILKDEGFAGGVFYIFYILLSNLIVFYILLGFFFGYRFFKSFLVYQELDGS